MPVRPGKLRRERSGVFKLRVGGLGFNPVPQGELAPTLRQLQRDNREVDVEVGDPPDENGVRVWPRNQVPDAVRNPPAVARPQIATAAEVRADEDPSAMPTSTSTGREAWRATKAGVAAFFVNPYTFLPFPPRPSEGSAFCDAAPASHAWSAPDCFAARLTVKLHVVTPLLLADAARAVTLGEGPSAHKVMPLRRLPDGTPLIAPTSVKGMLRAAFEAVTNSRLLFAGGHVERYGFRMPAEEALGMVPAQVVALPSGDLALRLLWGNNPYKPRFDLTDGRFYVKGRLMHAAWLRAYGGGALSYPGGARPRHGDPVNITLARRNAGAFAYDEVTKISLAPGTTDAFVCRTNENIKGKHNERVFFRGVPRAGGPSTDGFDPLPDVIPLNAHHLRDWTELVRNGIAANAQRVRFKITHGYPLDRPSGHGTDVNHVALSRHIVPPGETTLQPGALVYARFSREACPSFIGISPVLIGRDLYRHAPDRFLPDSIRPATRRDRLSPADRVFGWVSQAGPGAHRGQLRVGPVRLTSNRTTAIEGFTRPATPRYHHQHGLPLAILGQPKPHQARFYAAADPGGTRLPDGVPKGFGYCDPTRQGLRGRKVYPHHRLAATTPRYWEPPPAQGQNGQPDTPAAQLQPAKGLPVYREYLRRVAEGTLRDDQNRSITAWVKPCATFAFEIRAHNLRQAELGALLWLLTLPPDHHFRLGGGKPLGFGSVTLELETEKSAILDAAAIARRYDDPLGRAGQEGWNQNTADDAISAFRDAACAIFQVNDFERIPAIEAFRRAARGPSWPIHYPRVMPKGSTGAVVPPDPAGESFRWFVENEGKIAIEDGRGNVVLNAQNRPVKKTAPGYALPNGWDPEQLLEAYRGPARPANAQRPARRR
jgi:CRISPR-associated protein (TIGR03986 family)